MKRIIQIIVKYGPVTAVIILALIWYYHASTRIRNKPMSTYSVK